MGKSLNKHMLQGDKIICKINFLKPNNKIIIKLEKM